jgi:hypothetical protein
MNYAASLRRLLRCVQQPKVLERDAFGLALKQALGTDSVYEALQQSIEQAFGHDGAGWATHRSILRRFDFEQHVPRYRAAQELGISARRFYYLRAEAIDMVARYAETLIRSSDGVSPFDGAAAALHTAAIYAHAVSMPYHIELPPVLQAYKVADAGLCSAFYALRCEYRGEREDALGHLERVRSARFDHLGHASRVADAASAFVRGVMARHDGDAQRLSQAAHAAHAAAAPPHGFERWQLLLAAESALAHGDVERAAETIDSAFGEAANEGAHRFALLLALHRAQTLLLQCKFDEAIHAADLLCAWAAAQADVLSAAAALGARARLAAGAQPSNTIAEPQSLWHALYAEALRARADAAAGNGEKAAARANAVRRASNAMRYAGIEAHAAGTSALVHNDVTEALDAWRMWLAGRHAEQGFDILCGIPVRALLLHAATLDAVHRLAVRDHPEWPLLPLLADEHVAERFWNAAISAALEDTPPEGLTPLIDALCGGYRAAQSGDDGRAIASTKAFAAAVAVLVPFEDRAHFQRTLAAVMQHCNGRAHRWIRRQRARIAMELR